MASTCISFLLLVLSSLLSASSCCPRPCSCSDKQSRHSAECSFKELTTVPRFLPLNVTTVILSTNLITSVPALSFRNNRQVATLWMARNRIASIENGAFSTLVSLRDLDLSHNRLTDFPWSDLGNLMSLQHLKLDHNEIQRIPQNAFSNLKELNSLRLNNNRISTLREGTFDALVSLSYLQLHSNPFSCSCTLTWLKHWILNTKVKILDQSLFICASPEELRGELFLDLTDALCESPFVMINVEKGNENGSFYEGGLLVLTCQYSGNPLPTVRWRINSRKELALKLTENDSAEMLDDSLKVYNNGTLVVANLKREDSGVYSCSATNEAGRDEKSVTIEVLAQEELTSANYAKATAPATNPDPDLDSKEATKAKSNELPKGASKCSLTPNTEYASGRVANASFDDVKQYAFDFGVIALAVTETEATVRLNPLLTLPQGPDESSREEKHSGIFLCRGADENALQWTRLKEGVSVYYFTELHPGSNYSLCLTLKSEECDVQVHFTTRKRTPNLIIIISVSICLLTVSTVPLLVAMCYHLYYKYRSETYKMYLTARGQYGMERATFRAQTESEKDLSEGLAEEEGTDCGEKDTEESILADSSSVDKLTNECEAGSEYSDRLPLGAEALNITE